MKNVLFVILMAVGCSMPVMVLAKAPAETEQLRHLILLKFKQNTTQEQIEFTTNAFVDLRNSIEEISAIEWGENNSTEGLNNGFTHSYLVTFKNENARSAYMVHPAHTALGANIGNYIADIVIFDYWAH